MLGCEREFWTYIVAADEGVVAPPRGTQPGALLDKFWNVCFQDFLGASGGASL